MESNKMISDKKETLQTTNGSDKSIDYSIVVPISERYDDLREIYFQFSNELSSTGKKSEFIFVLDGSKPKAQQVLLEVKKEYPEIKIVSLNRSFGEATALSVGFEHAKGPVIITLSPYFQVEPFEIKKMLKMLEEEKYEIVISRRFPRIDSLFNRMQSSVFHWITQVLTGIRYHDISCGLRVMRREVTEEVHLYGDLHRFFPLLAYQRGFKIAEVSVRQSPLDKKRRIHKPGVYLRRLLDILTLFFLFKFTKKPLRFFGLVGSALSGAGTVTLGYLALFKILGFGGIAGRPLLILGVLLLVLGVQLFSIGLLGEIIIFTHASETKDYQVKKVLK